MNKNRLKAILEWIIAAVLLFACYIAYPLSYGNFSPIKAHQLSERTFHYGPSQIIREIDLDGGIIYLCRYKDWFSADTVRKGFIKWYPGSGVGGAPIDYSKKISYYWGNSQIKGDISIMKFYGIATDPSISTVTLDIDEKGIPETLKYTLNSNRMFIFYWSEKEHNYHFRYLRGLDSSGKVLSEQKLY